MTDLARRRKIKQITQKAQPIVYGIFRLIILLAISYIIIYPLLYMVSSALKTASAFQDPSVLWVPKVFTSENFKRAMEAMNFKESLFSTLKFEMVSALIETATCAVTAYGLARFKFPGKKLLMLMLILLIMVPSQMIIVPMTINFSQLDFLGILKLIGGIIGKELRPNILDTAACFYLPSLLSVGLRSGICIFIYHQFFAGLPKELEEAAWIDGSAPPRTFLQIALPSSSVAIITVLVLSCVWHWNDYYLAVMYTSENFPLAVSLASLPQRLSLIGIWPGDIRNTLGVMAGCVLFVIPILVAYLFLQRLFVKSIDRVGITG